MTFLPPNEALSGYYKASGGLIKPSGLHKGFIRPPEALLYPDSPPSPLGTIRVAQPWFFPGFPANPANLLINGGSALTANSGGAKNRPQDKVVLIGLIKTTKVVLIRSIKDLKNCV